MVVALADPLQKKLNMRYLKPTLKVEAVQEEVDAEVQRDLLVQEEINE
jgi:hypothetical protein